MSGLAVLVFLGGCLGAVLRFVIGREIAARWPGAFPVGTFMINLSGSFLLAVLWAAAKGNQVLLAALGAGLLGAYTTFSTFGVETVTLLQKRRYGMALLYAVLSAGLGVAGAWLGFHMVY